MANFRDAEEEDGVRMSWNIWPRSSFSDCSVPTAVIYTPLKGNPPRLPYVPLRCKKCRGTLNPLCSVDLHSDPKVWVCPFCLQRNYFPPNYNAEIIPLELLSENTTVEYQQSIISKEAPKVFLFVVDTCVLEDELEALKASLLQAVALLDTALVGLITFGSLVHVFEFGFSHIPKCYVFRPSNDHLSRDFVATYLGLFSRSRRGVISGGDDNLSCGVSRFFVSSSECQFLLNSVFEEMQRDPWPAEPDQRACRCTGTALSVATALLGICFPGVGARIVAFLGGPCTEGAGAIVSKALLEPIRSHKDINKRSVPYFSEAVKFYEGLAKQLVNQGHVLDLFACALDQVGVAEARAAVEKTGGLVTLSESFKHHVFKDSFKCIFADNDNGLGLSFNGIFEVICSANVKIKGILGACASLEKRSTYSSEKIIGQGNTTAWKLCGFDKNTSLCAYFDVSTLDMTVPQQFSSSKLYFQFLTYYQDGSGQMHLRSSTISRICLDGPGSREELAAGFDQETAAVVMARLAVSRIEDEEAFDAIRWLDKSLINLSSEFGYFEKEKPSSFSLPSQFQTFPQLMYHLRRSQFIQVFNYTPDETAYFSMVLNRENVSNSIAMIQPSLLCYSFHAPPMPVPLDASSISADRILLLDSYFTVVIFHGTTIAQWRKAGYHQQVEYTTFSHLLQAPLVKANEIKKERFPVPRLVICDQFGSQARFLLMKLNPSSSYDKDTYHSLEGDIIHTDDVSFQTFMDHLQRLVVQT